LAIAHKVGFQLRECRRDRETRHYVSIFYMHQWEKALSAFEQFDRLEPGDADVDK
jgi:hypothetical protein